MIFQTLSENYRYKQRKSDCIEIKVKIPLSALEKAIQEILYIP
jgi:hypothetical protein